MHTCWGSEPAWRPSLVRRQTSSQPKPPQWTTVVHHNTGPHSDNSGLRCIRPRRRCRSVIVSRPMSSNEPTVQWYSFNWGRGQHSATWAQPGSILRTRCDTLKTASKHAQVAPCWTAVTWSWTQVGAKWPEFGASYTQVGPKSARVRPSLRPRMAKLDPSRLWLGKVGQRPSPRIPNYHNPRLRKVIPEPWPAQFAYNLGAGTRYSSRSDSNMLKWECIGTAMVCPCLPFMLIFEQT